MKVLLGVSNKHIHLNKEDYDKLFGNIKMEKYKDLKQPGMYASNLFVDIIYAILLINVFVFPHPAGASTIILLSSL